MTLTNTQDVVVFPSGRKPGQAVFLNTFWQDLEEYGYISGESQLSRTLESSTKLRIQPQQQIHHMDLVYHFHEFAHVSLVTFGQRPSEIRDVLLGMALPHDEESGIALFHALLAFSSLHRYGLDEHTIQLKCRALHSLSTSVKGEIPTPGKAAQHVAASMLLGAFETLQPIEGTSEWLLHVWGATDMIQATPLKDQPANNDTSRLLQWVHYHETLSRFAMHHWRHQSLAPEGPSRSARRSQIAQKMSLTKHRPTHPIVNPTYAILNLLSEVCDTVLDPRDPRTSDTMYQHHLQDLKSRVGNVSIESASAKPTSDSMFAVHLYQIATQIYLARVSQSPWKPTEDLDALVDAAFSGPIQSCSCEHFFPLLILACEAHRDDQRLAIINLIERTQRDTRIRSIDGVRSTVRSIWAQQDLHKDDEILMDYLGIMTTAISSGSAVPSFA
ncbi:zinc-finger transcription factor [Colletotrichum camelliae]|nr:zinc-finger transcription factor [Colletotrichum camelliae]